MRNRQMKEHWLKVWMNRTFNFLRSNFKNNSQIFLLDLECRSRLSVDRMYLNRDREICSSNRTRKAIHLHFPIMQTWELDRISPLTSWLIKTTKVLSEHSSSRFRIYIILMKNSNNNLSIMCMSTLQLTLWYQHKRSNLKMKGRC